MMIDPSDFEVQHVPMAFHHPNRRSMQVGCQKALDLKNASDPELGYLRQMAIRKPAFCLKMITDENSPALSARLVLALLEMQQGDARSIRHDKTAPVANVAGSLMQCLEEVSFSVHNLGWACHASSRHVFWEHNTPPARMSRPL
jgi:hypothetical protein